MPLIFDRMALSVRRSHFHGFLTGTEDAESRWCTKALLTGSHNYVESPGIHTNFFASNRADRIYHNLVVQGCH
jgi:hypothetical protein